MTNIKQLAERCERLEAASDHDAAIAAKDAEIERLRAALRGLHDDVVDYQRVNNLGGYDNHWLVAARAALAAAETGAEHE